MTEGAWVDPDSEFAEYASSRWIRLVGSAVLLGCSPSEAEDLVQTTLMRAYVAWERVRVTERQDAYVAKILLNVFREAHRRRRWRERSVSQVPELPTSDMTEQVDDADAVRQALLLLPIGQREVLVLRYFTGLSEQQIAEALRIAPGTVKSRLSRALQRLAEDPTLIAFTRDGHYE